MRYGDNPPCIFWLSSVPIPFVNCRFFTTTQTIEYNVIISYQILCPAAIQTQDLPTRKIFGAASCISIKFEV